MMDQDVKTNGQTITAGELARRSGGNLETIRYYERRGLLPTPPRTAAGYRTFTADAVRRVRFIKHAQALGFTLAEVNGLLALRTEPATTCADVRRQADAKLADIDGKIRSLRSMRTALVRLAAACTGRNDPALECPILASLDERGGRRR